MPSNDPRPSKADRREAARAEAARLRAEQARKAKRTRIIAISGLAAAVIALAVVVALIITNSTANREAYGQVVYGGTSDTVEAPALTDVTSPAGTDDRGGIPVSADGVGTTGDAPVELTVYLDYQCPFCAQFEAANAQMLAERTEAGDISVTYHLLSFLDRASNGTFYSTRAANAAATVADQDPDNFIAFSTALFENQPAEGTEGLTDAEIAEIAQGVGVPAAVTDTFTDTVSGSFTDGDGEQEGTWRTYAPWVVAVTGQAEADLPRLSTPTILIDGQPFSGDPTTPGPLEEQIDLALAG
ncbi:DsbA family protein [Cellulomonas marina]|uniref:Protein-disulfide isomerase n=1 Tax=Cellulomonas marina TaxID=988821 RepID=A0A1I0WK09_9CELL|nr:thioredoxin domain-containing protein [Cellulomonas marina]GIG27709.1 hypothetical protein Cma02nite_03090 [Cellulomonas marina]SFA89082.1 Protein-disulfide isomerase [Cellulomonas marina]